MSIPVIVNVETCTDCPYCIYRRTPDAGYAYDLFCGDDADNMRLIAGYIEYKSEIPKEPPEWCPYRKP